MLRAPHGCTPDPLTTRPRGQLGPMCQLPRGKGGADPPGSRRRRGPRDVATTRSILSARRIRWRRKRGRRWALAMAASDAGERRRCSARTHRLQPRWGTERGCTSYRVLRRSRCTRTEGEKGWAGQGHSRGARTLRDLATTDGEGNGRFGLSPADNDGGWHGEVEQVTAER
jgi:hypothetical protein